jgi:hypothetical protein
MNERFKELYEKAHEQKPVMVVDPQTGNPIQAGWVNKPMYHNEFNPEKFAELIVKECIKVAGTEMGYSQYCAMREKLEEHFGVK